MFYVRILDLVGPPSTMEDNGATYFSYRDDGVAVYEEDVNTADAPTPLRPGYDGNAGSPNVI